MVSPGAGFLCEDFIILEQQCLHRPRPELGCSAAGRLWTGTRKCCRLGMTHPWPSPSTPAGITRDFMPLLPAPTFSTLGCLTLSHSDSGVQPSTWDRTPAATVLGEMLTPSCDGSFILGGLCLQLGLPSHRTGLVSPSPCQESYLCLGQGSSLPGRGHWPHQFMGLLSPSSFHGLPVHLLCSRPAPGTRILR